MAEFQQIIQTLGQSQFEIIGIDGELGAGKTTLAKKIAKQLHYTCFHLDSFLLKGQGSFLPSIEYNKLQAAISDRTGTILIEGICLLAVLRRLSLHPDCLIFVDSEARFKGTKKSPLLFQEVQNYLTEYSPRSKANVITSLENDVYWKKWTLG